MIIKKKLFTRWDDTDRLKQMKDSDILAEKKKRGPGFGDAALATGTGLAAGGAIGGLVGGAGQALKLGVNNGKAGLTKHLLNNSQAIGKSAGRLGAIGLVAGGAIAGGIALHKRRKAAKDNKFYNNRLEYAQRQAMRREKRDWKENMTQREGYTY